MNSTGKKARKQSGLTRAQLAHRTQKSEAKRKRMHWTKGIHKIHKQSEE